MFTYLYRFPWSKQNSSPLWRGEVVVVMTLRFMASKCHLEVQAKGNGFGVVILCEFWLLGKSHVHKKPWLYYIHITYLLHKKVCFSEFQPHLLRTPNTEFCSHGCGTKIGPVSLACCFLNEWIAWLLASIFFWIRRYSWAMHAPKNGPLGPQSFEFHNIYQICQNQLKFPPYEPVI